jgi:hypothetical protein
VPVSIVTRGGTATRTAPRAARIAVPITAVRIIRKGRFSISNDVVVRVGTARKLDGLGRGRRFTATYDYRPRAFGGPAVGYGRAVSCAGAGAGGLRSVLERAFRSAYNILRTRIVWLIAERKSSSEIALVS